MRAYAYTLVTTAVVLVFALAEWATERYVSEHSRAASTAIEIAIVLVLAIVFRPIHQRVETAVEAAFYKRKHHALTALAKFRRELSSFGSGEQLLRRVVEAVEHYLEASATAVYLHRDVFRAEASSFEIPAEPVPTDDPLIVRLKSSGAPADPALLKSSVAGTQAFPMTVAGELVGFLAVQSRHGAYDADETQMLAGLAQDLAVALVALEPMLRRARSTPNNIPANLPALVGRERELAEIQAALAQSRLVTIAGAGGVGKTCLALQCAAQAVPQHEHGAWFVNLAPITDGTLVAPAMLAALEAGGADAGDDLSRLVEHLRARDALVVIDNCEQVVAHVAEIVAQLLAQCPRVTMLATSRELLHLDGEQVYRLGPLRTEDAVDLFSARAAAVSPEYAFEEHAAAVRAICEHLDGIPLAIELAAARVRALSVEEIAERINERFRLLTGGARTAQPKAQTLEAAIEWSYGLLTEEEQSLFCRLATFRGSFSLSAAAAVCVQDGKCDEYHVLDVLTSLADKSLLIVTVALATRYRMLETIREFAAKKAAQSAAGAVASQHHAAYFANLAAQAYHEFDTRLPQGWLDRLTPDIDNLRAALVWTLEGPGDRRMGAQLAADSGPIFLRMQLLGEGLRWCEAARSVPELPPAAAGRIEYIASMMYNNLNETRKALGCAERAVSFYELSDDERGAIRALSQLAQLLTRAKRLDEAQSPAREAIRRARLLGEPRVLISVLRRCAFALPQGEIEEARRYYSEALELARSIADPEEACLVLSWWAYDEAACGDLERAIDLATQASRCADRDSEKVLETQLTTWMLALGRIDEAAPHARKALQLAVEVEHDNLTALGIAYCAVFHASHDAREAATAFGYAKSRLEQLDWEPESDDRLAFDTAARAIRDRLPDGEFDELVQRGVSWSRDDALRALEPTSALGRIGHNTAVAAGNRVGALLI